MRPSLLRSPIQKPAIALLITMFGLMTTTFGVIFALVDGATFFTPFWMGAVLLTSLGGLLCWCWTPTRRAVAGAVRNSWWIWGIWLIFALFERDWDEVLAFTIVLLAVLGSSAWLNRPLRQ